MYKISKLIIWILYNDKLIKFIRKITKKMPRVEEQLRVLAYIFKRSNNKGILNRINEVSVVTNINVTMEAIDHRKPMLYVDVSSIALCDVGTGIHRTVKSQLLNLINKPPEGYLIGIIRCSADNKFIYASNYISRLDVEDKVHMKNYSNEQIDIINGDVYFTSDLYTPLAFTELERLRKRGLRVVFTIYDLLPLQFPKYVPKASRMGFVDWLRGVMAVADTVICISKSVAKDLIEYLSKNNNIRLRDLKIEVCYLGSDFNIQGRTQKNNIFTNRIKYQNEDIKEAILMVGSLDPRKAQLQAIKALDILWGNGFTSNLMIVGKVGALGRRVETAILSSRWLNNKLFWVNNATDDDLAYLYGSCGCLLAASQCEGFGLPLVEAVKFGLPVLARDIPVFRELMGDSVLYFKGNSPQDIIDILVRWHHSKEKLGMLDVSKHGILSWASSVERLKSVILDDSNAKVFHAHKDRSEDDG